MTYRKRKGKLLTIAEFALLCDTTVKTLRVFENNGVLFPKKTDPATHYRYYSDGQVLDFVKIRLIQNFHVPLKKINTVVANKTLYISLDNEVNRVKQEIRGREMELEFLSQIKSLLFNHFDPSKHLKTEYFGPYVLFGVHIPKAEYHKVNEFRTKLREVGKKLGLPLTEREMAFYLGNEYKPKSTRIEIGIILKAKRVPKLLLQQPYFFKVMPKTKVKAYTYRGPYEYLILLYQKLYKHFEPLDKTLSGHVFDYYKFGPLNRSSKYEYLSKLCFPVK